MKNITFSLGGVGKACALLLLCASAAQATAQSVVLDSYGPGNATDGWPSIVSTSQSIAIPFAISSATSIEFILSSLDGVGGVTFGIMSRSGAVPTGTTGASWLYSTHLLDPVANSQITPSAWTLAAGNYWLAAVADAGFAGTWQSGTEDYSGDWAVTISAGAWQAVTSTFIGMPAARITVSAVPEPSSYALLIAGGFLLAGLRRKQGGAA